MHNAHKIAQEYLTHFRKGLALALSPGSSHAPTSRAVGRNTRICVRPYPSVPRAVRDKASRIYGLLPLSKKIYNVDYD
jgi:hypothetical protein